MRTTLCIAIAVVVAFAGARPADAYPQYQLSREQTCAGCHWSPAGGGLLLENGLNVAETFSQFGTDPQFMYSKVPTPDWLVVGGDARLASGYIHTPDNFLATFPMQLDAYGLAKYDHFRLEVTLGYQPGYYVFESYTAPAGAKTKLQQRPPWSREHYLLWAQNPDTNEGVFVRAGRFMPVFGLRLAEHTDYTRRFGGTQLYGETYGAAAEYITPQIEGHLTAFVADPIIDTVAHDSGVAMYSELRLDKQTAVGLEGMITTEREHGQGDVKARGGVTAKRYFAVPDILVQAEAIFTNLRIDQGISPTQGSGTNQLAAYVLGSWFATNAIMVDAGVGHYAEDLRLSGTARDCADVNVHWFATSHVEAVLMSRLEKYLFGAGGPSGGYLLLMAHYRL